MGWLGRMARGCAAFVVIGGAAPVAVAETRQAETLSAQAAQRQVRARFVVPLSRLHYVAQREIDLALLAQVAAVRPETVAYAIELETDFRALDGRIVAFAETVGISEDLLRRTYAGGNATALSLLAEDLDRLSMARGQDFDRQFWVMVAQDQLAASDELASAAGEAGVDRRLDALVAEMVLLLGQSSRKAVAAAASMRPVVPRAVTPQRP